MKDPTLAPSLTESCVKQMYWEVQCTLYQVSPNANVLYH